MKLTIIALLVISSTSQAYETNCWTKCQDIPDIISHTLTKDLDCYCVSGEKEEQLLNVYLTDAYLLNIPKLKSIPKITKD